MTFAAVNQGQTVTIASNVAAAASFLITGAANAGTTVTVTFPANLTFGANSLTFNGQIPRYNTVAGPAGVHSIWRSHGWFYKHERYRQFVGLYWWTSCSHCSTGSRFLQRSHHMFFYTAVTMGIERLP